MKHITSWFIFGLILSNAAFVVAQEPRLPGKGYETDYASVVRISEELHRALSAEARMRVHTQPLLVEGVEVPYVQPGYGHDGSRRWLTVNLSPASVDFINHLSHARAIDLETRGFLKQFLAGLATQPLHHPLAGMQARLPSEAWAFDTMNHQVSHFNQIIAGLIAINIAYHQLGYCEKYASQLTGHHTHAVPITSLITETEWRKAVFLGANLALSCGYGVAGMQVLFEAMDDMPSRPGWTLYFAPGRFKASKIQRDLKNLERTFFLGR